jgi:dipeptidyl aminopeptidase/acylaminoacyl peptidase
MAILPFMIENRILITMNVLVFQDIMNKWFLFLLFGTSFLSTQGQKPAIDSSVFGKWPSLGYVKISNDGKYVLYWTENKPRGGQTLVLASTRGQQKLEWTEMSGHKAYYFTQDSRKAIVGLAGDSLGIYTLNENKVEYFSNIRSFKVTEKNNINWLAYQFNLPGQACMIRNLITGKCFIQRDVIDYEFNENGNSIILQTKKGADSDARTSLLWLNLTDGKVTTIVEGDEYSRFTFDRTGKQLAFLSGKGENDIQSYSICLFRFGSDKAVLLASDTSAGIRTGFSIGDNDLHFSKDGMTLFFELRKKNAGIARPGSSEDGVNIWNYKDKYLQVTQLSRIDSFDYMEHSAVGVNSHRIVILNEMDEDAIFFNRRDNNKYVLVYKLPYPEAYYNRTDRPSLYLESVHDGLRILVKKQFNNNCFRSAEPFLSPNERFVVWFDIDSVAYFSYEIGTGIRRNISNSVPYKLYDEEAAKIGRFGPLGIAGWTSGDKKLLIYDGYDIWDLYPDGVKTPVNATHGRGRKDHIVFGIIHPNQDDPNETIPVGNGILMDGYNRDNKENGFWVLNKDSRNNPEKCTMDPCTYWIERPGIIGVVKQKSAGQPVKSLNANVYLVKRMSCTESPNLYSTRDFKTFDPISKIYPEKSFNWITSELITWKMSDGQLSQGVLYKPENFDSTKKYPVIFYYYEFMSDGLNEYMIPDFDHDDLNIPSYVSNGYLIFAPDVHFVASKGGWSVLNAVISAAKYLSAFSWIDTTKLGLMGHSFGGWETNFLITHSNLFAVAYEGSGISDWVSAYGQLAGKSGNGQHEKAEIYQGPFGLGVTPWTDAKAYIENSPIFYIDSITTPLLMMHCRIDDAVPFAQAIELFTGMKRAGKRVWLLEYDHGDHSLFGNDARDFTARMLQFFDHYLKGTPPPLWMTKGVPANKKGIENGLELDRSGGNP